MTVPPIMGFRNDRYRILFFLVLVALVFLLLKDFCLSPVSDLSVMHWNRNVLRGKVLSKQNNPLFFGDLKKGKIIAYDHKLPLIWIGGVPRSGTTLARAMLDAHPHVRCGEETRVIPRLLFMHNKMMMSAIERSRLMEAKVTEEVLDDALGAYILSVIVEHGEPAPRYCNKDPFTLKYIGKLVKMFPQSKFILMIRDGRAVVHSIISRKISISGFDTKTYRGALASWNRAIKLMWSQCGEVGPHICLPVHYEQLIMHPEEQMKKISTFLDIPWDSIVLHHEDTIGKSGGISLSNRERSTDQVNKPVNLDALYKWVGHIPEDVKKDMPLIAPSLAMLGYDPMANPPNYGEADLVVKKNL